jgi:superfamily II DNA or RNA helicase
MIEIHVGNSFSSISGKINDELVVKLAERLTYFNEEAHFEKLNLLGALRKFRGNDKVYNKIKWRLKYLEDEIWVCMLKPDLSFGTGLLDLVVETIQKNSHKYTIIDHRKKPESNQILRWNNKPHTLRYYQKEMLDLALREHRGVFNSSVGSGKTLIFTHIIKELAVDTLVVVPSTSLRSQIADDLISAFGKSKVQLIDTKTIKTGNKLRPIKLTTIQTLASLQKNKLLKDVIKDVDLLILDEAHRAGSKSYTDLLPEINHIYYRFLFSGTFLRNDSKTLELWSICSKVLYRYYPKKAIEDGFLTPTKFAIHEIEGSADAKYQKEYAKNYCGGAPLLMKLKEILENRTDKTSLILVNRKDSAGKIIHKLLLDCGIENTYISGDDKAKHIEKVRNEYNEGKIKVLIASQIFGEGVNVIPVEVLINCQGNKSEIGTVQAIGRGVRLFKDKEALEVHDFSFSGTKFLSKHLDARLDIYERNFGGEIIFEGGQYE